MLGRQKLRRGSCNTSPLSLGDKIVAFKRLKTWYLQRTRYWRVLDVPRRYEIITLVDMYVLQPFIFECDDSNWANTIGKVSRDYV